MKDTLEFYCDIDCAGLILPEEAPLPPPTDYAPDPQRCGLILDPGHSIAKNTNHVTHLVAVDDFVKLAVLFQTALS